MSQLNELNKVLSSMDVKKPLTVGLLQGAIKEVLFKEDKEKRKEAEYQNKQLEKFMQEDRKHAISNPFKR